ncbi:MAG: hypothetical protein GTO13_19830 [Proteobacteria bacterium]|nr:hypothetical protein [Pseudomonadota bacterium]
MMDVIDDLEWQSKALTKSVTPLLEGAIDMHYHGYPELTLSVRTRMDDVEVLELARDLGMRGIVIKSQMWPTTGRVYHLRKLVPEIECFASIVLNSVAGGLSPWVVEAAASQGAKVVWLPTWNSSHNSGGSFARRMKAWWPSMTFEDGLSCVDSSGKVLPEVRSILELAKALDVVLCTGHISPAESLAIAREAERMHFSRLVFTHPLSNSVGATLEQVKEMAERGAYVEFCALNVFYGNELGRVFEIIGEVGSGRCILSSDAFFEWVPPGPEFFRMLVGRLFVAGIDEESIRIMVRDNPSTLLGLPPISEGSEALDT